MKLTPSTFRVVIACAAAAILGSPALHAAVYINEEFNYTNGPLGSPWTVSVGGSPSSTITVATPAQYNDYSPAGKEITITRPSGGTAPGGSLTSGQNAGTTAWTVNTSEEVVWTFDFAFTTITNTQAFQLRLNAGGQLLNVRVIGGLTTNQATVQYSSNGTNGSYTDLIGGPTLSSEVWYRLTLVPTVVNLSAGGAVNFDMMIDQLGTGGGNLFTEENIAITHSTALSGTVSLSTAVTAGFPSYKLADIQLSTVPEPGVFALAGLGLAMVVVRRCRVRRNRS